MRTTNYSSLRSNLKEYLDDVEENDEVYIVNRGQDRGAVILSLSDYNALQETTYLLSSEANAAHLRKSIEEAEKGKTRPRKLEL